MHTCLPERPKHKSFDVAVIVVDNLAETMIEHFVRVALKLRRMFFEVSSAMVHEASTLKVFIAPWKKLAKEFLLNACKEA